MTAWDLVLAYTRLESSLSDEFMDWSDRVRRMSMDARIERFERIRRAMFRLVERLKKIPVRVYPATG